ncbi:hypothetical protein VaNZ11_007325, partial [Volvox africanus]
MSSLHWALPVNQPTETVFSPAFPSIDASLAGTCGGLLGIRPLLQLPASRRLSLEDKSTEAQVIRKSVSFSLRARGPGAGYNSASPVQQSPPSQRPDDHPEQLNSSGGGLGEVNEDVVRRLFRAVQGHANSPEPQPKAYPGWVPQPQQDKPKTASAEPLPAQNPTPAVNSIPALDPTQSNGINLTCKGPGPLLRRRDEAGPVSPQLEGRNLARMRPAISCASSVWYPLTPCPSGGAGFAAADMDNEGCASIRGGEVHSHFSTSAGPRHPLAIRQQQQPTGPQHEERHGTRSQQHLRTHVTGAELPLPASANTSAVQRPASAAASWDRRQVMPTQAASKRPSPSAMPAPASSAPVWGFVKPSSAGIRLEPPIEKPRPCVTRTFPMAARATSALPMMTETAVGITAAATVERSPVMSHRPTQSPAANSNACPTSIGGSQDATFEQVHMLLASLNLPGIKAGLALGSDSPQCVGLISEAHEHQSGDLAITNTFMDRVTELTPSGMAIQHPPGHGGQREVWAGSPTANGRAAEDIGSMSGESRHLEAVVRSVDVPRGHQPPMEDARIGVSQGPKMDNSRWPFDRMLAARGSLGGEWFIEALRPACCAWLQSVARIAGQQRYAELHDMRKLIQQIQEARLERRHVEAYLMGNRLGIPRARLARLHELAVASGASPAVTSTLLSQLEDRLRLKLGLKALRQNAVVRTRLLELLQSRHETGGPLAVAALQCWRRAAAGRLIMRGRVDTMITTRRRLNARRVLSAWRATAHRSGELRQLE